MQEITLAELDAEISQSFQMDRGHSELYIDFLSHFHEGEQERIPQHEAEFWRRAFEIGEGREAKEVYAELRAQGFRSAVAPD